MRTVVSANSASHILYYYYYYTCKKPDCRAIKCLCLQGGSFYNKFIILGMAYRNIFLKIILRYYKTTFKKKYNIFLNFFCVPISIFMFLNFRNESLNF